MKKYRLIFCLFLLFIFVLSCSSKAHHRRFVSTSRHKPVLNLMGYTIQAGAFKNVGNAVRLTEKLKTNYDLDATYFLAADKFFKVRFGNFKTKNLAKKRAQSLVKLNVIEEFYIVRPEDYSVARQRQYGTDYLRKSLVKTAKDFLGVPYLWGGSSPDDGFDCSGLTMTVYQLNGLDLPRNSRRQFDAGDYISKDNLEEGDLVFFSEKWNNRVSHVGIYIGNDKFIHASSHGKNIRIDNLSSDYFTSHYMSGRTYL
ncbi:MAG: C40 family peptidase [Syntrophaceae bacterium]|nr:C40 family peptidase [Syntrophaceae bacterium]